MGHYIANLRDIEFCLFDLLDRESILGTSVYKDLDRETVMGMLEEIKRLAENDSMRKLEKSHFQRVLRSLTVPGLRMNGGELMPRLKLAEQKFH
jgi:hypothetical protein